jgi:hypothetical protein
MVRVLSLPLMLYFMCWSRPSSQLFGQMIANGARDIELGFNIKL